MKTKSGQILQILIDTGSNRNYIQPSLVSKPIPNDDCFYANSIGGSTKITHHVEANLFGLKDNKIKFFLLPSLKSFDAILGNDSLNELSAIIYTKQNYIEIKNGLKLRMKQKISQTVNNLNIKMDHMSDSQKNAINSLEEEYAPLFSKPNEKLTYTTTVVGEIRTTTDSPVFTKFYPYPMPLKGEVESQIRQLLDDGIIRPSRSPYNSPVWVVPKKADSKGNKQYRVVIDYRKLNTVTIADRYPIPDINEVLSQLGRNKFFTVLDLKSGFHQIPLKESDVEKTAFSINNGKYEFVRLPFGLKNAPSIFQRALDDILRKFIGQICYVYIDDIIIFSQTEDQHIQHIREIFHTLNKARMKVQLDKCRFFEKQVEFLGFVVSSDGIRTNPTKVEAITNFPAPRTLKELRSFLGLSGYYRRFVKNYAKLAKPLTALLRGEDGRMSKAQSSKKNIDLNEEQVEAFQMLKNSLISTDVVLTYPDFKKPFQLTTDASQFAIGAVLSQDDRPITFISRTLNKGEEKYATNEKEMLAIFWALSALRSYLYGSAKVKIITDHQPLTFALSNKNQNNKLKRWKAFLEEFDYELQYQPGKTNVVADALSRIVNPSDINALTLTQQSGERSAEKLIPNVETPINAFKNQLFIEIGPSPSSSFKIIFPTYHRHQIIEPNFTQDSLTQILKKHLNPSVINGVKAEQSIRSMIQQIFPLHFSTYKIRFTQIQVEDVTSETEQEEIVINAHRRAHRNDKENKAQILKSHYFPGMSEKIKRITEKCSVCTENKYDRHPEKPEFQPTPIPKFPGQIVHIDIYFTDGKIILTAVDKFSKYALTKILKSRAIEDIKQPLREIVLSFGVPETIVVDNEKSLSSNSVSHMLENMFKIKVYKIPPYTSSANGQVERFHSTLSELMRCLKTKKIHNNFSELLDMSVYEYNRSIHSTTKCKPIDVFFGKNKLNHPEQLELEKKEIIKKIETKQSADLNYHNKNRSPPKNYSIGDIIYVKINKRIGNKLSPRYRKEIVRENRNTTVITKSGKTIHKGLIKH